MIIKSQNNHNYFSEKEKMEKYQEYILALEQEHKKIQVFQRELPLCLELVTQAIETCKQQLSGTMSTDFDLNGVQSECSDEQTSCGVRPLFEEFIPIEKASSSHCDYAEQESKNKTNLSSFEDEKINVNNKKSDWLSSVQLWNQTPDPPSKEDSLVKRNGSGGAFHPFKKDKSVSGDGGMAAPPTKEAVDRSASPASTAEIGGGNKKNEEKAGQRKSRRSWSPELHRRFVQALQQLGGSHVATPKQIREFMKVDGLTNDEVKSHLQKFRLHTRKPSASVNNNNTQTTTQFVVVGGIFLPPEYAVMATTTTATTGESSVTKPKGIYAPIATLPPPFREAPVSPERRKQSNSDDKGSSHNEGLRRVESHSPISLESTHMTAASPPY